jgi:hypothetical protein
MFVMLLAGPFSSTHLVISRFSATKCANVYNMTLFRRNTKPLLESGWQFGFKLKTEHKWDAFVILTLLHDCEWRGQQLELPHNGNQKIDLLSLCTSRYTSNSTIDSNIMVLELLLIAISLNWEVWAILNASKLMDLAWAIFIYEVFLWAICFDLVYRLF